MKEKALKKEEELLECEKLWIFAVMIAVGGFFGAYTYVQKGGVFCNAQTANFVLMAVQLGRGNWRKALYYLLPASAYLLGTVISEFLPKHINRRKIVRWDTAFVAFEMAWIFALVLRPGRCAAADLPGGCEFYRFDAVQHIPPGEENSDGDYLLHQPCPPGRLEPRQVASQR